MSEIVLHRTYEDPNDVPGYKILVDRLWPRGIKKEAIDIDWWPKDIAPTKELRKAFGHDESKFDDFKAEYLKELAANSLASEFVATVKEHLKAGDVVLLYGAKDKKDNQAVVLREWLFGQLDAE